VFREEFASGFTPALVTERFIQLAPAVTKVSMGFFSNLIRGAGRLVRGFLGGAPVATAAAAPSQIAAAPVLTSFRQVAGRAARRALPLAAAGGAFAVGDVAISQLLEPGTGADGVGGGNGRTVRTTIVVTQNAMTGEIIRREVRKGAPFLMGRDVQIANRVFRQSTRLQRRLPKKIVRQSQRSALVNRVVSSALERAACPTGEK